ncbi:zinc finger protein 462-like isoform X1 [Scyliorhinus canicula]|uniref:zinc finger protein 462-like isoform X1 n=2 Tax=Scyliorhinus canicula TaxID=7830 RepID=UPI0018F6416C|nr:zinc finger protein 462-like isoform X1 [Scyliorhinus canicula]XP_038633070.1 zinc finger protein 462-like isoform X1 [Scyliorhinus canicula]XP_038633071.1 zinc finger protein 462-like isoform X1 [Scyliorhinus canicula]XP_038633072.1 zinc finger protein 462-like isoform X1 [Scyliorhinus canicula]XP_038633073.1 zinc finger protein 462-like isoform X1 [Scyliorhinus canicula]XP_038633074.1 zinc finger protein 462-like isoform X1 [Scyliorhinus canicula]XP_038633075.1 zinc finger protein 462-li
MFHCNYCDLWTMCVDELDIHILETHADFQSSNSPAKSSNQIFPVLSCPDLQSTQPDMQTSVNSGQDLRFQNENAFNEDLIPSSHHVQLLDHLQISDENCCDQYGYKTFKESMSPFCETIEKLGITEESNKQVALSNCNLNANVKFASKQVVDVYDIAHDNECNKHQFSTKKSELDHHLLMDTMNTASYSAEELEIKGLGPEKLNKTILGVSKETKLAEDLLFLTSDGGQNNISKQINSYRQTKDGTELEVDGKLVTKTDKMSSLWCEYHTFSKQCFEDHTQKLHSDYEFAKQTPTTVGLPYSGCDANDVNFQVDSTNYDPLIRETIVGKSDPIRPECENPVTNITGIPKIAGCESSENAPQESGQKMRRTLKLKKRRTVFYIKRLCLFHCIICPFHTLYHRCVLRHVRNVHLHPSGRRKVKRCVSFSSDLRTLKLCKGEYTFKKFNLNNSVLPLKINYFPTVKPDTGVRSEDVNLVPSITKPLFCFSQLDITESESCLSKQHIDSHCEASLVQQISDQIQLSVPCLLVNDSNTNASSKMFKETIGVSSCFSTLMTPYKKAAYGDLNIKALPPSSKCLSLEAIVKNLKSRMISAIKCRPAVALLNDRTAKPKRSIPFCRTTEEQRTKWAMEAYSFLKQQKIERAAEFSLCGGDDSLLGAIAEIEVVLSDTDDDNYSQVYRNYGTLYENLAKAAEDKSKILCPTSSARKKPQIVCTGVYRCDLCPFSNANIMSVLSHYHRQHPEENMSCNRIRKYSQNMNLHREIDLPSPIRTLFLFDSESTDPVVPCFGESNEMCFCEYCSYSGDWVSLFEHCQKTHASIKIDETCDQKKSPRKIFNNMQVRAPLESTSTSTFSSEPQVVFQCQVCNFTCSSRRVICRHYCIRQSITCAQVEDSDIVYKCALCMFTHLTQQGLINHYLIYHDIEPPCSSHGMKTGHNELVSLASNDDDLKAGMEKQKCMLCSFKAITQKELLFHYKLRHPRFYSQNRCTIECKNNANLHVTNLDPQFYEIKKFRENGSECVNAMLEWGVSTASVVNTKEPLTFNDSNELEFIICKGNQSSVTAMPVRQHLRNQNNSPNYCERKMNNSFTMAINSINVTSLPHKQFSLSTSGSRCLEYNLIMPEKQNVDNSDFFCEFGDPLNTRTDQECIFSAEDDWHQGDLIPGNVVSSRAPVTSVKETYSESTVHSTALEGYRCRHCARLFKALGGLRNHEKTHCTSKMRNRSVTKSRKRKSSLKNGMQTASSDVTEGGNYRCPRCSYSTPMIEQLRSHSLKVHGRFLMPKLRAAVSDAEKSEGYVYQALNENVFLEFPHSEYQECDVQTSDSGMKAIPKPAKVQNYTCEFCTFTTCQFQNVKKHYRKVHRENLYFECRKCLFFSGKKNALSQHAEVCELTVGDKNCSTRMIDKIPFEESSAMAGSEKKSALFFKEDFGLTSTERESGMLRCPLCLYYTKHKRRMVDHILQHKDGQMTDVEECQLELMHFFPEEVFCCDWCTFVTLSQDILIHHMDTHSPVKPYKCRLCFFEARLQTELETHLQEQHKVKCNFDLVGEVNLSEADLCIEIEEFQRKRLKKSDGEKKKIQRYIRRNRSTKTTRFPCEFCGRRFLDHSEWVCHVQRHSIGS